MGRREEKEKEKEGHKVKEDRDSVTKIRQTGKRCRQNETTAQVSYAVHRTLAWACCLVLCPCALLSSSPWHAVLPHALLVVTCIHLLSPPLWNLTWFLEAETLPPSPVHPWPLGWPHPSHTWLQLFFRCLTPTLDSELLKGRNSYFFLYLWQVEQRLVHGSINVYKRKCFKIESYCWNYLKL